MSTSSRSILRRVLSPLLAALLTLAGAVATAPVAQAADTGWIRLTHLSPDTPAVNVTLTSLSNSKDVINLSEVGYGDISDYAKVATGKYVATMTPPGGDSRSEPAVSQPVTVEANSAYTVAAVGKNADLKGVVLNDDLDPSGKSKAKIRVLQASYSADTLTVTAQGGPTIGADVAFATATDYATVDAGVWTLELDPAGKEVETASVETTLASASVNTIIVLDGKDGKLTAKVILDAGGISKSKTPKKAVEAGGGGLAQQTSVASISALTGSLVIVVGLGLAVRLSRRQRG